VHDNHDIIIANINLRQTKEDRIYGIEILYIGPLWKRKSWKSKNWPKSVNLWSNVRSI